MAGPGVNPQLLGEVFRVDLGADQVTYNGHPLYLFDPGPNSFFGANFYETVAPLPPWHTAWFLLSPKGRHATGPAALETEAPKKGTTYDTTELATEMLPAVAPGGVAVSVYAFSGDTPTASNCTGACARDFIPVTTVGAPTTATGVNAGAVSTIRRGARATARSRSPMTATRCTSTARSNRWSGRRVRRPTGPLATATG